MPYKYRSDKNARRRQRRFEKRGIFVCLFCGGDLPIGRLKYCSDSCASKYYDKRVRDPGRVREIRKTSKNRLIAKVRSRISKRIKRVLSGKSHLVNYRDGVIVFTEKELKTHLEKRFGKGMTWENYGKVWHIDHKIPVSVFNLSCDEDIRRCWSLKNLQPLFVEENIKKGAKLTVPFQPGLI